MSFIAIDIGNTRLKWAHYSAAEPGAQLVGHGAVFLEALDSLAETQWLGLPEPASLLGCVVAGEGVRRRVEEQLELWSPQPHWVVATAQACGVENGYVHPSRLGADRWAALIGARHRVLASGPPRPALVVMAGTAVTVDALDASGQFIGGLILPGFGLMLRALESGTAGLHAPTGQQVEFPVTTEDALMSGSMEAIAGAVERMCHKLHARTGQAPALLMTGGAAPKLAALTTLHFQIVDTLIFEGLLQLQIHRLAQAGKLAAMRR
jgi:type III pantothenate kinase